MQNTKQATQKQLNFLINLGANPKDLENLTIKDASIMIGKLLKQQKENNNESDPSSDVKKEFTSEDLENLLKKYNAKYEMAQSGFYRNDKGSNRSSELLKDSRKFKSYILNVIKTEFKNIKVKKCSCSFQHYYNEHIDLVIEAPKEMIYKSFEDVLSDYKANNAYNTFEVIRYYFYNYKCANWSSLENATEKRIYDLYYKNIEHKYTVYGNLKNQRNTSILNDTFKNILAFIHELLLSFSYDNSSPETDYFDHGLEDNISFVASDIDESQALEFEEVMKNANDEKDILVKYPLSDSEDEQLKAALKIYLEEQDKHYKELEEQEKIRKAEYEKWAQEQKENTEYIEKYVEVVKLEEPKILKGCKFSTWNKAATIEEAIDNEQKHPESENIGTIAQVKEIINFKDEKAFNLFSENLLNNYSFLNGVNCGCGHVDYDTLEDIDYNTCVSMSLDEQEAHNIAWVRGCVIIALNGEHKYLVDTEGFNYCRYVGFLPDGSKRAPIKNDRWLSEDEKQLLKDAETLDNFEIWDFGAKRSKNNVFWEELAKLGTVTQEKNRWCFKKIKVGA